MSSRCVCGNYEPRIIQSLNLIYEVFVCKNCGRYPPGYTKVSKLQEMNEALKGIAPWLSASLDVPNHQVCAEYLEACNKCFEAIHYDSKIQP